MAGAAGLMAMAEMIGQPQAKVPAPHRHTATPPHRHADVDETPVIEGCLTEGVDGKVHVLQADDHCFSPRGSVHHFLQSG
jgi:hypothetical protein